MSWYETRLFAISWNVDSGNEMRGIGKWGWKWEEYRDVGITTIREMTMKMRGFRVRMAGQG